jgi:signal transduction histidine kinase
MLIPGRHGKFSLVGLIYVGRNTMKSAPHRYTAAALVLGTLGLPCLAAGAGGSGMLASSVLAAVGWLLLLGCGFQALLRYHLRAGDRLADAESQLAIERHTRALAERALGDTHAALGKLVQQQEDVRETERKRIARDIHDDLGQNLLALKIELTLMQASTTSAHPQLSQKVGQLVNNLDLTIKSLRAVINNLRPLALDAGLQSAMEWQLSEFSRINGIRHELKADPEAFQAGPGKDIDAMLFRILQESLANVVRHAQATEVKIGLHCDGGRLTLKVQDNGIGMPAPPATPGCGLLGIKDRVTAIGGQFAIDSQPGGGTVLSLSIPLALPLAAG